MATSNLTRERTGFVGRRGELDKIGQAFASGRRLVTLVGPPGIGKTRLAREFGAAMLSDNQQQPWQVWFCDLTEARSREGIVSILTATFDIHINVRRDGDDVDRQVVGALAERGTVLLILDNFEQVVAESPTTVGLWLDWAPNVRFLVTSREPLHLSGEAVVEIGPLQPTDAIKLFAERAAERGGSTSSDDDPLLEQAVRRLDGIPLALELAAGRASAMSTRDLIERLSDRFQLLKSFKRDAIERQRTLEAAIDWSWRLLSQVEQDALRQLSVFHGGFTLDAAEHVVELGEHADQADVVELVFALRDKSLLTFRKADDASETPRFGLLESIREFVSRTITAESEVEAVAVRHAQYLLDQAEQWEQELKGPNAKRCRAQLAAEVDNLNAIFHHHFPNRLELATRAALALTPPMFGRGLITAHLHTLNRVIEQEGISTQWVIRCHLVQGEGLQRLGEMENAVSAFKKAFDLAKAEGETVVQAKALLGLATLERIRDKEQPRRLLRQALELAQAGHSDHVQVRVLAQLGIFERERGNGDEAQRILDEGATLARSCNDLQGQGSILMTLAGLAYADGRLEDAEHMVDSAIEVSERRGDRWTLGMYLTNQATLMLERGRISEAEEINKRALAIYQEMGSLPRQAVLLFQLGVVNAQKGELDLALEFFTKAKAVAARIDDHVLEASIAWQMGDTHIERGSYSKARQLLERALGLNREIDNRRGEKNALTSLAILHLFEDELSTAQQQLKQAVQLSIDINSQLGEGRALVFLAAAEAMAGRHDQAKKTLKRAQTIVDVGYVPLSTCLDVVDHMVTGSPVETSSQESSPKAQFVDVRLACQLHKKTTDQPVEASDQGTTVIVGPEGRWFLIGDMNKVDLSRRGAMRRILHELALRCTQVPGKGTSVDELTEVGWPGQNIHPEAAATRVYTAIRSLRRIGLDQLILTNDEGYLLDPSCSVIRKS